MDEETFGAYSVKDRGDPPASVTETDWPRYWVAEQQPGLGPIMRAGPFHRIAEARAAAQALAAADEAADDDEQRKRRR